MLLELSWNGLIGWKPRWTLIGATGLLGLLPAGMCIQQKWDVVGTQMVYAACFYLLGSELTAKSSAN